MDRRTKARDREQRRVIYEELARINSNFDQARAALGILRKLPGFERTEIDTLDLLAGEARAAALSYLLNVVETAETDEAARLERRRLRQSRI